MCLERPVLDGDLSPTLGMCQAYWLGGKASTGVGGQSSRGGLLRAVLVPRAGWAALTPGPPPSPIVRGELAEGGPVPGLGGGGHKGRYTPVGAGCPQWECRRTVQCMYSAAGISERPPLVTGHPHPGQVGRGGGHCHWEEKEGGGWGVGMVVEGKGQVCASLSHTHTIASC